MDAVNKTLYIPLYGKALVSRAGILLHDPKAEEIWAAEGFELRGRAASKWLAYSMAMRAAVFDEWTAARMEENPDAVVLHLGCGLDSRCQRIGGGNDWYDVDFPEVIRERRKYYSETEKYHMVPGDLRQEGWLEAIPAGRDVVVIMEGVSMYLPPEALEAFLRGLGTRFSSVWLLMDCYSVFAAKASRYKNPIHQVGVTEVYGLDDPAALGKKTGLVFEKAHCMTPARLICQLGAGERVVFSNLYAGKTARRLYRLYEFRT